MRQWQWRCGEGVMCEWHHRQCATCKWFHRGVKVDHSHCECPYTPRFDRYTEPLRKNGKIEACCRWEIKGDEK